MSDPETREASRAIQSIATLPVFFKLEGRRVIVAGGSLPAVWKSELLAAAGAQVDVVADNPCLEMVDLVAARPDRLTLFHRRWTAADLDGAAIAVGALAGTDAETFRDAARSAGVPVNVIDVPSLCDFQFGTIVERSPLVIGISTDGAAPVLGQALRARIEALLPEGFGEWARVAKAWRAPLQALGLGFTARRRFWERFTEMALEGGDRRPTEANRQACMAAADDASTGQGRLFLVGVGPGHPDLVTLQAVKALQSAELILHQPGLHPAILGLARREARRLPIPDLRSPLPPDAAIAIANGQTVVIIALGDPMACRNWPSDPMPGAHTIMVRGLMCDHCPQGCGFSAPPDREVSGRA